MVEPETDTRLHRVLAARNVQDTNHGKPGDETLYAEKGLEAYMG